MTEQEFLLIYDQYADAIYRHCFFRMLSKELAEDLVQETFARAWEYAKGGKPVEHWQALLYRIATNLVIDHTRKKKEARLEEILAVNPSVEPRQDQHIEADILWKQVQKAFDNLREYDRTLLILRYVNDLDPKEIAEILGTNANNISVKLHHAVNRLKQIV